MASYFVAHPASRGVPAVHDRTRCPPGAFPQDGAEYLGEFIDAAQALAVARLRYPQAARCSCCTPAPVAALRPEKTALSTSGS